MSLNLKKYSKSYQKSIIYAKNLKQILFKILFCSEFEDAKFESVRRVDIKNHAINGIA